MFDRLPADLKEAENQIFNAIEDYLKLKNQFRASIDLRFEGLRLMPVAIRISKWLVNKDNDIRVLWPDAGATALAQNDAPDLSDLIFSFKEFSENIDNEPSKLLLAIGPQPYDYDEFQKICSNYNGPILMLNGRLEDSVVGIGSVARQRRKDFISNWEKIYWLEPLTNGAIMKHYPGEWKIFKSSPKGYTLVKGFSKRPDNEEIQELLLIN